MDLGKVGKFICRMRKENSLTQNQLGEKLGISGKAISKWERGVSAPDISVLKELSEILGVSIQELLAGEKFDETVPEDTVEDITISTIGTYNQIFKKKYTKVIIILSVIILLITITFSVIYMIANYNKCSVYGVMSENNSVNIEGLIANNQKESSLIIAGITYTDSNVKTADELIVNDIYVVLIIGDESIYNKKYNYKNVSMKDALKNIYISVNESPKLDSILSNKQNLKKIKIVIKYYDIDKKERELNIPIRVEKRFSNNRIIY